MTLADDVYNKKLFTKRESLERLKSLISEHHELFSSAEDSYHTYLDVAEHCIDGILNDEMYGTLDS